MPKKSIFQIRSNYSSLKNNHHHSINSHEIGTSIKKRTIMKSNKKIGQLVGLLLLLIMSAGIPGTFLRGINSSLASKPDFLNTIVEDAMLMRLSITLDMLAASLWIGIIILVFPLIKAYKESIAMAFFGLWMVYFGVIIFGNISHLSLLSLGEEFSNTSFVNPETLRITGLIKIKDYLWSHHMALMLYASATSIFYFFLYKSKLLPKYLAIWGMIAMGIVFTASWFQIFNLPVSLYAYGQNGIHMIVFTTWLLIKGFNSSKAAINID